MTNENGTENDKETVDRIVAATAVGRNSRPLIQDT